MLDYQIVWRGPVMDATGYGTASRGYALALDRLGVDVKIETYTWNVPYKEMGSNERVRLEQLTEKNYDETKKKILIYHAPPSVVQTEEDVKFERRILNTVWETETLPSYWLPIIDKFDAVCVPCSLNVKAMKNSGVQLPIFLAPHGVDTEKFNPENKKISLRGTEGKFVFISVFDFQHRKNPETLLEAYWKEFKQSDQVVLIIKTYADSQGEVLEKISELKRKLGFGDETAPLFVMTGTLEEMHYLGLYTLGNAYVLPTRAEGVGIPFMEALSSRIPVITTGWGGQMDYLNENNSFFVDYQLRHPGISVDSNKLIAHFYGNLFLEERQIWADADVKDLMKKMRYAYENPEICKQKGNQGRADMFRFSWDHAGLALMQAIEQTTG
jgi:glycosyltransferase involved in cell wall biosynthesis